MKQNQPLSNTVNQCQSLSTMHPNIIRHLSIIWLQFSHHLSIYQPPFTSFQPTNPASSRWSTWKPWMKPSLLQHHQLFPTPHPAPHRAGGAGAAGEGVLVSLRICSVAAISVKALGRLDHRWPKSEPSWSRGVLVGNDTENRFLSLPCW